MFELCQRVGYVAPKSTVAIAGFDTNRASYLHGPNSYQGIITR